MSGQSKGVQSPEALVRERAMELLSGGMPLTQDVRGARAFVARSDELLRELEGSDPLLALQLLVAQTVAFAHLDHPLAAEPARLAEAAGARIGTELADAYARFAWAFAHPEPEHAAERERAARHMLTVVSSSGAERDAFVPAAHMLLYAALLEQGKICALDAALIDAAQPDPPQPFLPRPGPTEWFRVLRLMLDGELVMAESQVAEVFEATRSHDPGAFALYTAQCVMIHWLQGREDASEDKLLAARREYPEQLFWATSLAKLWFQQGRMSAAESLLDTLPEAHELPRDTYWLATVATLGEIALISGSRTRAMVVRDLLEPYAGHLVSLGAGIAFAGTVARLLGRLEHRLGNPVAAREHFELAVAITGRIGALAWHAEAQIELAEFAIRHEILEIPSYALLTEARATSEARGFRGLALRAMHRPRVRVLGTFEVVSFCGTRAEWSSRKARELLKMLIAARGNLRSREVYMEILWPGESPNVLGNRFSVAVNVVRRALDPQRLLPTQHHVITEGDSIRLDLAHLDIDLERFLMLAKREDLESREEAANLYRGEAFSDEVYADWAAQIREHAKYWYDQLALPADRGLPLTG